MFVSPEQMQFYSALAALVFVVVMLILLVGAIWWHFGITRECQRRENERTAEKKNRRRNDLIKAARWVGRV